MNDDHSIHHGEGRRPLRLQFSLRSLLIATSVIGADLAIVAQAGSTAVLGLIAGLASLALGIGGMLIAAAMERCGRLNRHLPRIGILMMGSGSVWLFILGAVAVIALNVLAMFPPLFEAAK